MDRTRIEQLANEGNRAAESTRRALKTLSFQLSGAQLGITATSLLVGFLIEPTIARPLEPAVAALGLPERTALGVSIAIALGLVTTAEMVIAELIPKNLAIARPLRLSLAVATPLRISNTLLGPLIILFNSSANATVRLLGIEPQEELQGVPSLEELQVLIRSSREGGTLEEESFSLLTRSISFGDKTAGDALVPRVDVVALQQDEPVTKLRELGAESGHSRFPVYGKDLDDIVGIALIWDSYALPAEERPATPVSQIMQPALFVPESRDLASLLSEMRRDRKQMAVIIDEYGGTAGILTLEDLLEEIVGEIEDEYDVEEEPTGPEPPEGVHVVSGMLHPDEVKEVAGFEMPEGEYDTLAGFLLTLFDRIPTKGDHASYDGWEFKVVEMERQRISKVLIVAPAVGASEDEPE